MITTWRRRSWEPATVAEQTNLHKQMFYNQIRKLTPDKSGNQKPSCIIIAGA